MNEIVMEVREKVILSFFLALAIDPDKMFENNNYKRRKRMRRPIKTQATAYSKSFYENSYPSHLQFRRRSLYNAPRYSSYGR